MCELFDFKKRAKKNNNYFEESLSDDSTDENSHENSDENSDVVSIDEDEFDFEDGENLENDLFDDIDEMNMREENSED